MFECILLMALMQTGFLLEVRWRAGRLVCGLGKSQTQSELVRSSMCKLGACFLGGDLIRTYQNKYNSISHYWWLHLQSVWLTFLTNH